MNLQTPLAGLNVEPFGPGAWLVPGREQPFYRVEIRGDVVRCECPDHQYRGRMCRHIKAVWTHLELAPIAAVPAGPAFEDVPLPDAPPDDLDIDDEMPPLGGELVAESPAAAPVPPAAVALPIPAGIDAKTAEVVAKWQRARERTAAARDRATTERAA